MTVGKIMNEENLSTI
jgi:hypothetical protein